MKTETRLLNIMSRDLKLSNEECVRMLNKESVLSEAFHSKTGKWKFEGNSAKYVEIMKKVNEFLSAKGMNDTVFRNPENYEISYEDFHYFYPDKTVSEYMSEEEERCLATEKQTEKSQGKLNTVIFGNYCQSSANSTEPIEWIVLKQENDKMLVLSKNCLDCGAYHKDSEYINDWSQSTIKKWLNETFYNEAFDDNQKIRIIDGEDADKITLLTPESVLQNVSDKDVLKAKPTAYALSKGARTDKDGFAWWWLAHKKANVSLPKVPTVSCRGSMGLRVESNYEDICIRPSMWIKI